MMIVLFTLLSRNKLHITFVQGLICGLAIDHIPGPSTCQVRALVFGDLLPLRGQVFPSPPPLHTLVPTLCRGLVSGFAIGRLPGPRLARPGPLCLHPLP